MTNKNGLFWKAGVLIIAVLLLIGVTSNILSPSRIVRAASASVIAQLIDGPRATYSASAPGTLLASGQTHFLVLMGSGTKTIHIHRITIFGVASVVASSTVRIEKLSTADSGGTSTSITPTQYDSNDAAPTATAVFYTANPTVGTATVVARLVNPWGEAASDTDSRNITYTFGDAPGSEELTLRGTSEGVAINFAAVAPSAATPSATVEWSED